MANAKGYYDKILVVDTETTGLCSANVCSPDRTLDGDGYYQAISYGLIVCNSNTLEVIQELYLEIKWDGISIWDMGAQRVHGLSKDNLNYHGIDEEAAMCEIATMILNHFGQKSVTIAAHNPAFDIAFLDSALKRHDIHVKFSNRRVDTSTLGCVLLDAYTSDQLFDLMGIDKRGAHNSLEDARCVQITLKNIKKLWKTFIG